GRASCPPWRWTARRRRPGRPCWRCGPVPRPPCILRLPRRGRMTRRTDAPGPLLRRGPRPLLLHLTLAMLRSSASRSASLSSKHSWPNWNATIEAMLRSALQPGEAEAFPGDVLAETLRRDAALIEGIAAYRRHPWRRELPDPPEVWQEGGSRMLDYGAGGKAGSGPAVLFVPSLVNRAY